MRPLLPHLPTRGSSKRSGIARAAKSSSRTRVSRAPAAKGVLSAAATTHAGAKDGQGPWASRA